MNYESFRISFQDSEQAARAAYASSVKYRQKLIELGCCPDCLTVPEMDEEGPFSSCECGTGEDYAKRKLQQHQLSIRKVDNLESLLLEHAIGYENEDGDWNENDWHERVIQVIEHKLPDTEG